MQHNDLTITPEQLAKLQAEADHQAHIKAYIAAQQPQDGRAGLYTLFSNQHIRSMFVNYLDVSSVKTTQLLSKQFRDAVNKNNQEMLYQAAVNQLPQYVFAANWKMIETLVNWNPDLIFKKFKLNLLGQEMETSVLDYACYMRDKYTFNICKKALRPDQKKQYSEIVRSYSIADEVPARADLEEEPGFLIFMDMIGGWLNGVISIEDLRNYLIQQTLLKSHKQGIYCLEPFYWVCEAVRQLLIRAFNDDLAGDKLDRFVNEIDGFAKRYLLARHMRKQMQAHEQDGGRYRWQADAAFNESDYPVDCSVSRFHANVKSFIDPDGDDDPDDIFGKDYSLKRGILHAAGRVANAMGSISELLLDYTIFIHLDRVRRLDIIMEKQDLFIEEYKNSLRAVGFFAEVSPMPADEPLHLGNFPILPFDDDLEEELKRLQR